MKTLTTKQKVLTIVTIVFSFNLSAQTFWTENFGTANSKGDKGNLAYDYNGSNGQWTASNPSVNGKYPNQWYVSSMEAGVAVGSCSKRFTPKSNLTNNTLHVASSNNKKVTNNELTTGDIGANYKASPLTLTDNLIESPYINCTNRNNITLSFDYFCGARPEALFSVYYHDGIEWNILGKLNVTKSDICNQFGKMMWMSSPVYTLPESLVNNDSVRIGFRWVNDSIVYDDLVGDSLNPGLINKFYSVAIDNIVISGNFVDPNNNANRTASNTSKIDIKTVSDKKNNPTIVFTTYNEKFPANDLIIESSTDGTNFDELSKIKSSAVKGSVKKLEYNFTDSKANDGVNYYRIKQVNADKTMVVSEIVSVDHIKAKNITFTVYPNPNSGQFTVDFSGIENNHEVQIVLNDMNDGHEIYSTTFSSNSIESNKMDVNPPTKIAPGRYLCSLIFEGIRSSVIVMIN
jgi:hypothetical protein